MGHAELRFTGIEGAEVTNFPFMASTPRIAADDSLMAHIDEWNTVENEFCDAVDREHDLHHLYEPAPIPSALFRRHFDLGHFGGFMGDVCLAAGDRRGQYWYGSPRSLNILRAWQIPDFHRADVKVQTRARIDDLLAAANALKVENERRLEACGLAAAIARRQELGERSRELRARIIAIPAYSDLGLLSKAKVFGSCHGATADEVQAEAEKDAVNGDTSDMTILLSLGADVLRMAERSDAAQQNG